MSNGRSSRKAIAPCCAGRASVLRKQRLGARVLINPRSDDERREERWHFAQVHDMIDGMVAFDGGRGHRERLGRCFVSSEHGAAEPMNGCRARRPIVRLAAEHDRDRSWSCGDCERGGHKSAEGRLGGKAPDAISASFSSVVTSTWHPAARRIRGPASTCRRRSPTRRQLADTSMQTRQHALPVGRDVEEDQHTRGQIGRYLRQDARQGVNSTC